MATWELVLTQEVGSQDCNMRFFFNNLTVSPGTPGYVQAIIDQFATDWLPAINAIQSDQCLNKTIYCRDLANPITALTGTLTGTGDVAASFSDTMPPDLPLHLKLTRSSAIDVETNAPYVGTRPIGSGGKFFPGLTEDWSNEVGVIVPALRAASYTAMITQWTEPLDLLGSFLSVDHVLYSPAKEETDTLPARNALVAPVSGVVLGRFTRLKSRRPE